jgi:hypothetical protein
MKVALVLSLLLCGGVCGGVQQASGDSKVAFVVKEKG